MGNKVLRQRLKGPAVAAYYPRKLATIKDVKKEFGPTLATWDDAEEDRFQYIEEYDDTGRCDRFIHMLTGDGFRLKARGKSAPKKKTVAPGEFKKTLHH